ncbi:Chitinase 4 [Pseudogymnoascus australis]
MSLMHRGRLRGSGSGSSGPWQRGKIVIGMPIYGRSFEATTGLGKPFTGIGSGTWENGNYDPATKELIDTPVEISTKSEYVKSKGLGGAMFWETSSDSTGSKSLISTAASKFGALESSQNLLSYPASVYENSKAGMPGHGKPGGPIHSNSTGIWISKQSSPTTTPIIDYFSELPTTITAPITDYFPESTAGPYNPGKPGGDQQGPGEGDPNTGPTTTTITTSPAYPTLVPGPGKPPGNYNSTITTSTFTSS